jgi:hypothetical protein
MHHLFAAFDWSKYEQQDPGLAMIALSMRVHSGKL